VKARDTLADHLVRQANRAIVGRNAAAHFYEMMSSPRNGMNLCCDISE
jgi:hypothetical protein